MAFFNYKEKNNKFAVEKCNREIIKINITIKKKKSGSSGHNVSLLCNSRQNC